MTEDSLNKRLKDLDDKLREKLKALVFDEWDYTDFLKEGLESYVTAIKQAFHDEGYIKPGRHAAINQRLREKVVSGEIMTGQEWYNRFEKELKEEYLTENDPAEQTLDDHGTFADILETAKKASGVKE